jgi:medium-chain acyl-[acyl-carrier-protein] hydrolase
MEWPEGTGAERILLCCHHAGGGAAQFREWQTVLGPGTAVLALQLPGRQNRWDEAPVQTMEEVLAEAVPALLERLTLPYVVFGHSMGGAIGFELGRRLGSEHNLWPTRLILSAAPPPHRREEIPDLSDVRDADLIKFFVDSGAIPSWVLEDPDLQSLLVPPLRGDLAIGKQYEYAPGPPVPCALSVCGGIEDSALTPLLEGWRHYTSSDFQLMTFQGGHMFYLDPASDLLPAVKRLIEAPACALAGQEGI